MSWGITAIGKPQAVAAKLADEFTKHPCIDPEEGVRQAAANVIAVALAAQDPNSAVKVMANGHQFQNYDLKGTKSTISNTLSITVEPVSGFVE
jgi:ABC-type Zn2+ transport system substrate-binding protein/surface adhesin